MTETQSKRNRKRADTYLFLHRTRHVVEQTGVGECLQALLTPIGAERALTRLGLAHAGWDFPDSRDEEFKRRYVIVKLMSNKVKGKRRKRRGRKGRIAGKCPTYLILMVTLLPEGVNLIALETRFMMTC